MTRALAAVAAVLCLAAFAVIAPPASAAVRLVKVAGISRPVFLTAPARDRDRVFVVQQPGTIRIVRNGKVVGTPFLDIRGRVQSGGEAGLLSMAFAPDYATSHRFYVYYTDRHGDITVAEFRSSAKTPDRASPATARLVLRQRHDTHNHKGGSLQFGPDGLLYVGLGDGGPQKDPRRRGQSLHTWLGKILRIDPRRAGRRAYRVPRSNPFAHRRGARPEIWAYGVRNPWRFSFTPAGAFVLGDVGQDRYEEVDYVRSPGRGRPPRGGYNFGWSVFEGRRRFRAGRAPGHVPPVLVHRHPGLCSIIGGYVIRDRSLGALRGRYVYGDFCNPRLRVAKLRAGRTTVDRPLGPRLRGLTSFGQDGRGRLWATSFSGVYRLARR